MRCTVDKEKKLAIVYCSHADQNSEEAQQRLNEFIADCREKKIYVCVFESGDGDLMENTKELLVYNYNNAVTRSFKHRSRDKAR